MRRYPWLLTILILAGCEAGRPDDVAGGSGSDAATGDGEEGSPDAGAGAGATLLPASVGPALHAANDAELTQRLIQSSPGQHIILTGSSYSQSRVLDEGDMVINENLQQMPVIGGSYQLAGNDSMVHGLDFKGANVSISGDRAQVSRSRIHDLGSVSPVSVGAGDDVVIAYNEIYRWGTPAECGARRGITIKSPTLSGLEGATRIKVFRNHLHDQIGFNPESCANDGEVIAAGQTQASGRSESRFEGHFHHNLIVNCMGDDEGFGVKSSYNLIEFNHLIEVRGFNLRLGGFNKFIGNRVEGSRNPSGGRGDFRNLSLGEVFDGPIEVRGGDSFWGEGVEFKYMAADGAKIIGAQARAIEIGIDERDKWDVPAMRTLVEATNVRPTLGDEQEGTINRWDQPASMAVPQAIRLTPADVGPLSTE